MSSSRIEIVVPSLIPFVHFDFLRPSATILALMHEVYMKLPKAEK